jgi:HAE1 family hydrophobic/amphiphilic exporter-1
MNFFVRNKDGEMLPAFLRGFAQTRAGPEFTSRFNEYRAVEITGSPAPGYSTVQAMNALEQVAIKCSPKGMGYDWNALSYQQNKAIVPGKPGRRLRLFAARRVPDPRGAV